MSMSGGWFFLSVCEAFTLGDQQYRLPGIGAYMATAIVQGKVSAMVAGVVAMSVLIVVMDVLIWRPVLAWPHQFRLEDIPGFTSTEPLMRNLVRQSTLLRSPRLAYKRLVLHLPLLKKKDLRSQRPAHLSDPRSFIQ